MKEKKNKITKSKKLLLIIGIILIILILSIILYYLQSNKAQEEKKIKNKISNDAVEKIFKRTKEKDIKENIEFDTIEKDGKNYKITFFYAGTQFEYVVDANSKKIISNTLDDYEGSLELVQSDYISIEEAKKLVIEDINPKDESKLKFKSQKTEKEFEQILYYFKAEDDHYKYSYIVDGIAKKVLPQFSKWTQK